MKPRDVVVVALPRSVETLVACFAVLRAGAIVLPIDLRQPAARNKTLVDSGHSRWALIRGSEPPSCVDHIPWIAVEAQGPAATPLGVAVQGDDDACLIFTSGSTGEPKGVRLSHRSLVMRSSVEVATYGFTAADVYLFRTSPAFIGLAVGLAILAAGVTTVVVSEEAGERADELARIISAYRVTFAGFSPRLLETLLERPELLSQLASLRAFRSAGEALAPQLAERFHARLAACRLIDGYGTTETSGVIASSGIPVATVRLRLAGPEDEIWVSTPMLATGYLNGEPEGEPRFVDEAASDGNAPLRWYRTGDRGRLSPAGHLTVLGRLDLQLNLDGVRAEPKEIEDALRLHEAVADAAVRTHPDSTGRERLVAYVVDRGGAASTAALRTHLSERLPAVLIPSVFVRLPALRLTASGKVDRSSLPDPLGKAPSTATPRNETEALLLSLFRDVLGRTDLSVDDDFFEWGGDSLKAVALMTKIDQALAVRLSAAALLGAPTVASLARLVERGSEGEVATNWLREGGDLPPLICLPGLAGDPMWFFPLIQALDSRQPLLGLSFVGLKPPIAISSASAFAVLALRSVQPRGPYFLLGHSVGGVLAFEMARQLQAEGETVAFIGLIDTFVPGKPYIQPPTLAHRLKRWLNRMIAAPRSGEPRGQAMFMPGLKVAAQNHRVAPGDLGVTLFRANERSAKSDLPGDWRALARRGVDVVDIPGHHFDLIGGGRAKELSARIAEVVSRSTSALRGSSSPSS